MDDATRTGFLFVQIPYRDAPAAIAWLERAFGLTTTMAWPDEEGGIQHAELSRGDAAFTVFSDRAGYARPEPRGETVGFSVALVLGSEAEVDEVFASAEEAGAEVVVRPVLEEWGNYRARVRDPEGYEWTLCTYRPGLPQEWSDEG